MTSQPLADGSGEDPHEGDRCPECHFPGRPAECANGCTKSYARAASTDESGALFPLPEQDESVLIRQYIERGETGFVVGQCVRIRPESDAWEYGGAAPFGGIIVKTYDPCSYYPNGSADVQFYSFGEPDEPGEPGSWGWATWTFSTDDLIRTEARRGDA